ncbi:MAG TPA: hypothetical protein VFZ74_03865 [Burkholderiales bacterium]
MLRAIVLAVALLAAQQNALAHAAWHAAAGSQTQDKDQGRLCDLHSALGAVLGVLSGKTAGPPACATQATPFDERTLPVPRFCACSPLSRGPPAAL